MLGNVHVVRGIHELNSHGPTPCGPVVNGAVVEVMRQSCETCILACRHMQSVHAEAEVTWDVSHSAGVGEVERASGNSYTCASGRMSISPVRMQG